jgi:hypothetical protein
MTVTHPDKAPFAEAVASVYTTPSVIEAIGGGDSAEGSETDRCGQGGGQIGRRNQAQVIVRNWPVFHERAGPVFTGPLSLGTGRVADVFFKTVFDSWTVAINWFLALLMAGMVVIISAQVWYRLY